MPEMFLQKDERVKLNQILASLYDFTGDARDRRVIMDMAGLGRFIPAMNLTGSSRTVTAELISRLESFGTLPEDPTYHALGALLSYLLTLSELSSENTSFIATIIVKYSLVSDPIYIDNLCAEYQIADIEKQKSSEITTPIISHNKSLAPDLDFPLSINEKELEGLERIITDETNFLDIYLLIGAIYSAQAVGRIEIPEGEPQGTGFLIGPDLLLTNQHVLKNKDYVSDAVVRFDYKINATGVTPPGKVFCLQSNFYESSPAHELDYALVRLEDKPLKHMSISDEMGNFPMFEMIRRNLHRGYLMLVPRLIKSHDRVNIIQHPDGNPLKVVMNQNYVVDDMSKLRVQYIADTKVGSSGSPVFNNKWEVVALHHSGKPHPPESVGNTLRRAWKKRFRINEGIPIRAILEDFKKKGIDKYLPDPI